jgi:hypothetical protein
MPEINPLDTTTESRVGNVGHNSEQATVKIEARLFNSLFKYAADRNCRQAVTLPAGSCIGDLAQYLGLPSDEVFLVLRNGRDVTPGLVGDAVNLEPALEDGDVIAFSGPVPYSYGYGAPVV